MSEVSPRKSTPATDLYRDKRDEVAAAAIKRESVRWGWDLTDSIVALFAARAIDALDQLSIRDWRCECGDLNREHEAFCYRCGAGQPEVQDGA